MKPNGESFLNQTKPPFLLSSSESKDRSPFLRFLQKIWVLFLLFLGRKPKK